MVVGLMNGDLVAWEGAFLLYQYSVEVVVMDLDVGVYGRVTSPRNGSMASVQVGKAVFVKESYTTLGIKPRTYSYPWSLVTILVSVGLKKIPL